MGADFVFFPGERRPYAVNADAMIAVGSWLYCRLVGGMDEVIFTGYKYSALFGDVGGKTPDVSSGKNSVKFWILKYRRTGFGVIH